MAEERVDYHLAAHGSQGTARSFDEVTASLTRNSAASQLATRNTAALGSGVAAFGTVVARVNPMVGQFAGVLGTAGGAVSALGGAFGPLGIAVGALIAGFGAMAIALSDTESETRSLDKAAEKLNRTLEDQIKLIREREAASGLRQRVGLRVGSITEQQGEVERLRGELNQLRIGREQSIALSQAGIVDPRSRAEQQRVFARERALQAALTRAERGLADARESQRLDVTGEDFANVDANLKDIGGKKAGAPRQGTEADRFFAKAGGIREERLRGRGGFGLAGGGSAEESFADAESKEIDRLLESWDLYADKRQEQMGVLTDREKEEAINRLRAFEEHQKARMEFARKSDEQMAATASRFGEAGAEAFVRLAIGQKATAKEILAGLGDTMIAEGSRYVFRGAIEALLGNPKGGAVALLGTAEIATGVALGGIFGGSSTPAVGSGGSARPAEPTRFDDRSGDRGSTTTVINVDAMVADANAGRRIHQALQESDRSGLTRRAA